MEWNVYITNINTNKVEVYNVFNHHSFKEDCDKAWEEYGHSFDEFEKRIREIARYYFWSKCEWEIIISDFPHSEKFREAKIDVYHQLLMNWDVFVSYIILNHSYNTKMNGKNNGI